MTRLRGLRRPGRALLRHTCQKHKQRALQAEKMRDKVPEARNRKVATMAEEKKRKRIPGEGLVKMSMAAIWSEAMLLAQIDSNFLLCRTRAIVL